MDFKIIDRGFYAREELDEKLVFDEAELNTYEQIEKFLSTERNKQAILVYVTSDRAK